MADLNNITRFEDIDPDDRDARLKAAMDEMKELRGIIDTFRNDLDVRVNADAETFDRRKKERSDYIARSVKHTGDKIEIMVKHGEALDNLGHAAKMARKESDDLNSKYGRYVKK